MTDHDSSVLNNEPGVPAAPSVVTLKARIAALQEELRLLNLQLDEAIVAESPVKVGQIYERQRTRGWGANEKTIIQRGQVLRFRHQWQGPLRPCVTLFKADGSLGARELDMYDPKDWRLVPQPEPVSRPTSPNTDEHK